MVGLADFEVGVLRVRGDGVSRARRCICREAIVKTETTGQEFARYRQDDKMMILLVLVDDLPTLSQLRSELKWRVYHADSASSVKRNREPTLD
jgi:hypothetical protein